LNLALRVVFAISSLLTLSFSGSAQTGFDLKIGPPKAAIIGATVGVGAGATVLVLYLALRNPAITGCTQSANGTFSLTDDKDHLSYALVGENSELKAGVRVKLQGKKKKDKQGKFSFRVAKITKDYGACQQ
jgi:hypothetical protein